MTTAAGSYAEYYGGVFPVETQVLFGVVYGPNGNDLTGSMATTVNVSVVEFSNQYNLLGFDGCISSENLICKHVRATRTYYFDLRNVIPDGVIIVSATADTEDPELTIESVTVLDEDLTIGTSPGCSGTQLNGDRAVLVVLSGGTVSEDETVVILNWVQSDGDEDSREGRFIITGTPAP